MISSNTTGHRCDEVYDLCIIDGPKNWTIDGAAFFCVDKLLKKNGWIIFDDYSWTYAEASNRRTATDGITHRHLSKSEQETPHIQEVFELLVKQHPSYSNFAVLKGSDWALAQKTLSESKIYTIEYRYSYRDIGGRLFGKMKHLLQAKRRTYPPEDALFTIRGHCTAQGRISRASLGLHILWFSACRPS